MDGDLSRLPLRSNTIGQGLLVVSLALLALGVVMVYSASMQVSQSGPWLSTMYGRHVIFACAAVLTLLLLWRLDYHVLERGERIPVVAAILLGLGLALAVIVLFFGVEVNGAKRWFRFSVGWFTFSFQPSELVKIALVIFLACWLGRRGKDIRSFKRTFLPAVAIIGVCAGLVVIEDFGTATVIAVSAGVLLLLAGVPWYYMLTLIPVAAGGFYKFVLLEPNRLARIEAFINPWADTRWTYQVRQSLIAIGSGGLWGKGLGYGQVKLGGVPENKTDFIFAVICEELGFVGAALLLGMFLLLLYLFWRATCRASDSVGRLLAGGLGLLIVLQALAHVAVNIGSAPPTGMSLPLLSAGGTALVLVAASIAVVISVTARSEPLEPSPRSRTRSRRDRS